MKVQYRLATPYIPGAIAVIDLYGSGIVNLLQDMTGSNAVLPQGKLKYCNLFDIDSGLVVSLNSNRAQIMFHGGIRVIQRMMEKLISLGCEPGDNENIALMEIYPEASSLDEAVMLSGLSEARSSLAVELLLQQPERWQRYRKYPDESLEDILSRSYILNRLLQPPVVVIVGPANVGKSTLTNALIGRAACLTHDEPGTTRDYVGVQLDLAGLVVWWFDTPGLRTTKDTIENLAADNAKQLIARADYLILAAEPGVDWPGDYGGREKSGVLKIMLKADLLPDDTCARFRSENHPLNNVNTQKDMISRADLIVCAHNDSMLSNLVVALRDRLVPNDLLEHPGPWVFDKRLIEGCIDTDDVG